MSSPPIVPPIIPVSGELAVKDSSDIQALLPGKIRESPAKPLLDNLIEALAEIALAWQDAGSDAAAQSDVATSTDQYLDGLASDRSLHRAGEEDNAPFRARVVAVPALVDAVSVRATADAILARYTTKTTKLFDSILDRLYITDGTASWHSFIGDSPQYPDRLYPDDADLNGGVVRPASDPGCARVFPDHVGREFVLRVPDISGLDEDHMFVFDQNTFNPGAGEIDPTMRAFIGDGSQDDPASFVALGPQSALDVYQSIADNVERIIGAGFRWELLVDPAL